MSVTTGDVLCEMATGDGDVTSIAWSPDGRMLASARWMKGIDVWDPISGRLVQQWRREQGNAAGDEFGRICWSPNSRHVAAAGNPIQIFDVTTRDLTLLSGHIGEVIAVTWHPNGARLASAGLDQTVRIWETTTWQELITFRDHKGTYTSIAWSPDGRRLAAGCEDGTILIWDASGGYP
jgi:WD40 repeat protein